MSRALRFARLASGIIVIPGNPHVATHSHPPGFPAALGYSRSQLGLLKLPFDLTPIGMKGCHLYQSFEHQVLFAVKSGVSSLQIPIPSI